MIEWRPMAGFETLYAVSDRGDVVSVATKAGRPRWRPLASFDKRGYSAFKLHVKNISHHRYGHRLVWEAFVGLIPEGLEVNHKNGVRGDNRLENLELVTRSENMLHGLRTMGRHFNPAKGSRHGCAKLSESDIPVIRTMLSGGRTQSQIAETFGVSKVAIGRIARGQNWRHVEVRRQS